MPEPALYPPFERTRLRVPAMRPPHECKDYAWRVLHTRPESIIGYWPLDEVVGTVAHDLSGRRHNGAYTGVDLARTGIGDGRTCPYFDGSTDYVNIFSAALASAFNGAEGTVLIWGKVANAGVWGDGTFDELFAFQGDANNYYIMRKTSTANTLALLCKRGATALSATYVTSRLNWMCITLIWSAGKSLIWYLSGEQIGATLASGIWAGALTKALIGSQTSTPTEVWSGNLAHCALWNCALSAQEIERLGRVD